MLITLLLVLLGQRLLYFRLKIEVLYAFCTVPLVDSMFIHIHLLV